MSRELQEFSIMVDVCFEPVEVIEQEESLWDQILVLFIWLRYNVQFNKLSIRAQGFLCLNLAYFNFQINFAVPCRKEPHLPKKL